MDAYEVTRIVFSRIQSLEGKNATKIIGLLLIQGYGEKEMTRLALGTESLNSFISKAKKELNLPPSSPSPASSSASNDPFFHGQNELELLYGSGYQRRRSYSEAGPSSRRKPCWYYVRGFCKDGSECRFHHADMAILDHLSRQIYLTFPAHSTFTEEDVSNYFSLYGSVQDVTIPYQLERVFGFVTFFHPETVRLILAKANPHFFCDSTVLVKPCKDKGSILKNKMMQAERGESSAPTGLDARDPFEFQQILGLRMMQNCSNNQEEQMQAAQIEQAIELQGRRLMELLDKEEPVFAREIAMPNEENAQDSPFASPFDIDLFASRKYHY